MVVEGALEQVQESLVAVVLDVVELYEVSSNAVAGSDEEIQCVVDQEVAGDVPDLDAESPFVDDQDVERQIVVDFDVKRQHVRHSNDSIPDQDELDVVGVLDVALDVLGVLDAEHVAWGFEDANDDQERLGIHSFH